MFKSSVVRDRVASNVTCGSNVPAVSDSSATKAGGGNLRRRLFYIGICYIYMYCDNVLENMGFKERVRLTPYHWKSYL